MRPEGCPGEMAMNRDCHGRGCRSRWAFTLVEMLVVIAVIAVLLALLIPAVITARRAARRAQCGNNIRQLATAVQQYHDRNDAMPPYWGLKDPCSAGTFGGWLVHLLPDLDQQALVDRMPGMSEVSFPRYVYSGTSVTLPAVPQSPDWNPGTLVSNTDVYANVGFMQVQIRHRWEGRRGHPGRGPITVPIYTVSGSFSRLEFFPFNYGTAQQDRPLSVLACNDDPSAAAPTDSFAMNLGGSVRWTYTNYLANPHAFTRFNTSASGTLPGRRILVTTESATATPGSSGLFSPALSGNCVGSIATWLLTFQHANINTNSLPARKFEHLSDGQSNTILFAEAMRQCDAGRSARLAFLNLAAQQHNHMFGMDFDFNGHTLMFQARPNIDTCNKMRPQANHGYSLVTAMADGSVRSLSMNISRRELVDPDVEGRQFGLLLTGSTTVTGTAPNTYNPRGRGAAAQADASGIVGLAPDGIWDMLLMPDDRQVLRNSGEVGHER